MSSFSRIRPGIWAGVGAIMISIASLQSSFADNILYFVDGMMGAAPDSMAQALADPAVTSIHSVTTATSLSNFETQVATGNFGLAILFQQASTGPLYDAAFAALDGQIAGGRRAIAADWSQNGAHADGFQTGFTGGTNQTQFTISNASLQTAITNPVNLTNPGYTIFSTSETALGGGSVAATFANATGAIVIGNSGRTIFNGFLNNTFVTAAVGKQLYLNELNYMLSPPAPVVPEPATIVTLLTMCVVGLVVFARRVRAAVA